MPAGQRYRHRRRLPDSGVPPDAPTVLAYAQARASIATLNVQPTDLPAGARLVQHTTRLFQAGPVRVVRRVARRRWPLTAGSTLARCRWAGHDLTAYLVAALSLAQSASIAHRSFLSGQECLRRELAGARVVASPAVGDERALVYQPCTRGSQELQGYTLLLRHQRYLELLAASSRCPAGGSGTVATALQSQVRRLATRIDARLGAR